MSAPATSAAADGAPIGIFGGAFAPFHNGHLRLAIEARERLQLDHVRLIPTAHAAHRPDSQVSGQRRLDWVRAAIRREPALVVDDRELRREGVSYTVDTLAELQQAFPGRGLVLLMGADAFGHLHTWSRWPALLELAHLAVVSRSGARLQPSAETAAELKARRTTRIEDLHAARAGRWLQLDLPQLDISSTRIRRLLKAGQSVRGLVPDAILHALTPGDRAALMKDDDATTH